jgi:hypothetical protein
MLIGLQHAEVLLILKHIHHCIMRTRTDRTYCLYVGIPLGGCISLGFLASEMQVRLAKLRELPGPEVRFFQEI